MAPKPEEFMRIGRLPVRERESAVNKLLEKEGRGPTYQEKIWAGLLHVMLDDDPEIEETPEQRAETERLFAPLLKMFGDL